MLLQDERSQTEEAIVEFCRQLGRLISNDYFTTHEEQILRKIMKRRKIDQLYRFIIGAFNSGKNSDLWPFCILWRRCQFCTYSGRCIVMMKSLIELPQTVEILEQVFGTVFGGF